MPAARQHRSARPGQLPDRLPLEDAPRSGITRSIPHVESDAVLRDLLQRCRCVIYTPEHEHFGLVPLEAMAAGILEMEQICINTTRLFFNLMVSQIEMNIAELNLANNDTILKIARGRFELGKIAENELVLPWL